MKIRHILCMLMVLTLVGCELDYAPENTYVDEKVYKQQKTAQAALMGCYVRLNVFLSGAPQDQNNYSNNGYTYLCGDLTTENLAIQDNVSTFIAVQNSEFSSNEHDGILYSMWRWGYNCVDYANNIIRGINKYGTFDEKAKKQYIAEARFIRAYVYLQMLALYGDQALLGNDEGDGLVMQLDPYNGYDPDKPAGRSSNKVCWNQIITDLELAIPDLSTTVPSANARTRATQSVAKALLSRVYLWKGTFKNNTDELNKAAQYAREVLADAGYSFNPSYMEYQNNMFPSNEYSQSDGYPDPTNYSSEVLFSEPSRIYTANYPNGMAYYSKKSYYVPVEMLDVYDEYDVRRTYLLSHGSLNDNAAQWTSAKYLGGMYDDVIYLRLSEVKLTLAEAIARTQGITNEALQQLNDVHQRAYPDENKPALYQTSDFSDKNQFIRTVLTERRKELAYEAQYRYDLIRTNNMLGDNVMGNIDSKRWNLPVPNYEIRLTEGLIKQNTGYLETE